MTKLFEILIKKLKIHNDRSITFSNVSLQLYLKGHSSMDVFHIFQIVQVVPYRKKLLALIEKRMCRNLYY